MHGTMSLKFSGKSTVERDRPQMTLWRKRIACWIPKTKNTHTQNM